MRDLNILQHLLVTACLLNLFVGTPLAAPPSNVQSVKKLSDNDNPNGRRPFSFLVQSRDRRVARNDALLEDAAPQENVQNEKQKREVGDMGKDRGHDRWVRNADVAQVQVSELDLREDDVEITAGDGLLERIKRMAKKMKKKKKKGKKSKKGNNKSKKGQKKPANGKKQGSKTKPSSSKKKPSSSKKKPSSSKKKPSSSKKNTNSKKKQNKGGKKQAGKKGKNKSKKPMNMKPKLAMQNDMLNFFKLKSVKPLFMTCVLYSLIEENPTQEMSKYVGPLAYLLMAYDGNGTMMNTSMASMMAMNDSSMMAMNDSSIMAMNDSSMMSHQGNDSMMNSTLSLASLLNSNTSTRSMGHYYYTFGDSVPSFPRAKLPLMNFGDRNITEAHLMHIKELLKLSMSLLFKREGTRYGVDDFLMALEMHPQNASMPASMSMEKDDAHMVCPSLQNDLLSGMNGLMTKNLVRSLHYSFMALLTNDTAGFVKALLSEADNSFEILYLMRFTGTRYEDNKKIILFSCLLESLLDGYVGRDILMYLFPYLTGNMMMVENGTMSNNNSMMGNSSMSDMMNDMMTMMPMNESNSTSAMPRFDPSTIQDSQYCRDKMIDPKMIFMYVMNMTNMNMSQMNTSMTGDGMNMMNITMSSPMATLKSILAMLERSKNGSMDNATTAPRLLLPAMLVYLDNAHRMSFTKAIHDAIRYLINYGTDMESDDSSMEDMMERMNETMGNGTSGGAMNMMNMSSSMNATSDGMANETMSMMGEMNGMGIPDGICPAVVMEFLPRMEKPMKMVFFRSFLWASKYLLCGDVKDSKQAIIDIMYIMDMMEEMDGDDGSDGGGGGNGNMLM